MHISKALKSVRSHIRGVLERHHHSPTIVNIFGQEIDGSISSLEAQFKSASQEVGQHILWPKMVLEYKPDGEEKVAPVWSPIKDGRGYILGVKVVCKGRSDKGHMSNAYLEWFPPEP